MIEYSDRLRAAMEARSTSVSQLAAGMGVSYQAVKRVLDGLSKAFSAANNARAASHLLVNPDWLATGEGPMRSEANTLPGPDVKGMYPLLSEVQAGQWTELCPIFQPSDAADWRPSTKNLGPCGFMLRVRGRSMENPGAHLASAKG